MSVFRLLDVRKRIGSWPRPAFLLAAYAIGYFTIIDQLLQFMAALPSVDLPLTTQESLKSGYIVLGVLHPVLATARHLARGAFLQRPLVSSVPPILAFLFTFADVSRIGLVEEIEDRERLEQGELVVTQLEEAVVSSLREPLAEAQTRLDIAWQILREGASEGLSPGVALARLRPPDGEYEDVLAFGSEEGTLTLPALGSSGGSFIEELLARQGSRWLAWSELGPLVVSARSEEGVGTLLSATSWPARSFLEATRPLWEEAGYGVFLLIGDRIAHTSEISEFGEPLAGERARLMPRGSIIQVLESGQPRYLYQKAATNQDLFPGVDFRVRLADSPAPGFGEMLTAVIALLFLVIMYSFNVYQADAAKEEREAKNKKKKKEEEEEEESGVTAGTANDAASSEGPY